MNISKSTFVPFVAAMVVASPVNSVLAADGYNTAFQTCQTAIYEKFGKDKALDIDRKSFRKQGKIYTVRYSVRESDDDAAAEKRHIVTCKTSRKGELKTLEVKSD